MGFANRRRSTVAAGLRIRWNARWDFGAAYRGVDEKLESDELNRKLTCEEVQLSVRISF